MWWLGERPKAGKWKDQGSWGGTGLGKQRAKRMKGADCVQTGCRSVCFFGHALHMCGSALSTYIWVNFKMNWLATGWRHMSTSSWSMPETCGDFYTTGGTGGVGETTRRPACVNPAAKGIRTAVFPRQCFTSGWKYTRARGEERMGPPDLFIFVWELRVFCLWWSLCSASQFSGPGGQTRSSCLFSTADNNLPNAEVRHHLIMLHMGP